MMRNKFAQSDLSGCGLTWQGINLDEQCLTIKRSIRYDGSKHRYVIGPTRQKKVRIVDFGVTLTEILKKTTSYLSA